MTRTGRLLSVLLAMPAAMPPLLPRRTGETASHADRVHYVGAETVKRVDAAAMERAEAKRRRKNVKRMNDLASAPPGRGL